MLTLIMQDLRFTFRTLARNRLFASVSVLSLALGIGVNVSIASFINALFLRPLPGVPESDRLISIYLRSGAEAYSSCSYPDYEYYRDGTRAFLGMLAYLRVPVMMRIDAAPERVFGELVSGNYFSVLEARPTVGRFFGAGEDAPVAVLSHQCWMQRFGGDPGVVGRTIVLGNGLFTIVGVAPPGFRGIVLDWVERPSIWVSMTRYRDVVPPLRDIDVLGSWGMQSFQVVGRLQPGMNLARARQDMAAMSAHLKVDHPERARIWSEDPDQHAAYSPVVFPTTQTRFWPGERGNVFSFLGLLTAVSVLILLIACFNVANLVLARSAIRRSEFAVRLSLGAAHPRLFCQLLIESLVLSGLGGLAGLLVATWTSKFLATFHQAFRLPLDVDAGFDLRVFGFAVVISIASGLILAFFPARLASTTNLSYSLKADTGTAGVHRLRTNYFLVLAQVSLSVVLLLGAGLFVRTLRNAQSTDVTRRSEDVLLGNLDLASRGYDESRGSILYSNILERVRALPGVTDAAMVFVVPLGGQHGGTSVTINPPGGGRPKTEKVGFNAITPGYFRTIGIPLVRGRDLAADDRKGSAQVAVINEEMARRFFAGSEPVGQQFLLNWRPAAMVEVVGVVRDGRFRDYRSAPEPTVYVPLAQRYQLEMNLEVRTAVNPSELVGPIRMEIAALDKDLPLIDVKTLKAHFDEALSRERLTASLLTVLGFLALVLAAVGIYGVLSNSVAQRTREIGIRVALGADRMAVLWSVLAGAMRPVVLGLVIGTLVTLASAKLIRNLLYGLSATDPLVFVATFAILLTVALLAAYIPARRAAKVDPVAALRHE